MDPALLAKKRDFEAQKARTKLALNICTICGNKGARACQGCGTTAYCSTHCQRIDWRDRGHRKVCKKIQAAEAARAEAPTRPPSPQSAIFYGPAPRSHADEVRARIAAEHEAARARREANPEREPMSARFGSRCPVCMEDWNETSMLLVCCCRTVCQSCANKFRGGPCPLCRTPRPKSAAEILAHLRRHVENEVPEAISHLGSAYREGVYGLVKSAKKAAKLYKRAVELGNVEAMVNLGFSYETGDGVKLDTRKADQLYKMAAELGNARAQFNLGNNNGRSGNYAAAFSYYKSAANQGHISACYALGTCFEDGYGVDPDLDEAKRWYARAADRGHEEARAALVRLSR